MKIIGLCGGSGSGKGTVSGIFDKYGIPCVDTDAIYREITDSPSKCLAALEREFGSGIITDNGALNRKLLADIVFSGEGSGDRLLRLNEISHRYILDETRRRLAHYKKIEAKAAVVDAPVLFESGFDRECDLIVCVLADREIRIERIMGRDGISRDAAERRIASQMSDEELINRCDYIIRNDRDLAFLEEEVKSVINKILINN